MKAVILAGGMGSRLSEETQVIPKPLVEVGGKPILWHIMKFYSYYGINDFVICCGYKGFLIKEYFANYFLHMSDVTFDLEKDMQDGIIVHQKHVEPWRITLIDTGDQTKTGGRLKQAAIYVGRETFCMTYGDGVSNVDLSQLIKFHRAQKRLGTVTAVQPPARFGAIAIEHGQVVRFQEKVRESSSWINGGFFVLEPGIFDYISGDESVWEQECLNALVRDGQLSAYEHYGFWQCMDTLRDKMLLEQIWNSGGAPWYLWQKGTKEILHKKLANREV